MLANPSTDITPRDNLSMFVAFILYSQYLLIFHIQLESLMSFQMSSSERNKMSSGFFFF